MGEFFQQQILRSLIVTNFKIQGLFFYYEFFGENINIKLGNLYIFS